MVVYRVCSVVTQEMDNYEPCIYTKRVLEAVTVLRDQGECQNIVSVYLSLSVSMMMIDGIFFTCSCRKGRFFLGYFSIQFFKAFKYYEALSFVISLWYQFFLMVKYTDISADFHFYLVFCHLQDIKSSQAYDSKFAGMELSSTHTYLYQVICV